MSTLVIISCCIHKQQCNKRCKDKKCKTKIKKREVNISTSTFVCTYIHIFMQVKIHYISGMLTKEFIFCTNLNCVRNGESGIYHFCYDLDNDDGSV